MATVVPYIQADTFGGPAGSTQQMVQNILDRILYGQERRRVKDQDQMVSGMYQNWEATKRDVTSPDSPYEPAGATDPMGFVEALLGNPKIDVDTKKRALQMLASKSDIEKNQAYAEYLRQKPNARESKQYEIGYWDPDGKRSGGKVLVTDAAYNSTVQKLEKAGYSVQKPEKDTKDQTSEFERLIDRLEGAKNISETQKNSLIKQRVQKMVNEGSDGDETNKITLGDGQRVTLAELRAQYREKYNIPDEFQLTMMEVSADPAVRQQALRLKADAATKPSFVEFMREAKGKGLEGLRPGGRPSGGNLPPLPPGFKVD